MAKEKPARTGNRREFVRTIVPLAERLAGFAILVLLMVIGVVIAITGKHFNPDLYTVRTDSLKDTASAVEGKAGTVPAEGTPVPAPVVATTTPVAAPAAPVAVPTTGATTTESTSEGTPAPAVASTSGEADSGGGEGGDTPKPAPKGEPMDLAVAGIKPMSDTEFYNSDTLYEKIDGRSPAYQGFNVVGLRCRSFSVLAASGSYVDVYEYTFDSPVDAFGMYALEKDPKGGPVDFAPDGYASEMGYFFRQGAVYVQILASDQKPETMGVAKAIAVDRAKILPVDDHGLAGRKRMPADGMVAGSVAYVPDNAQGQASLKDVFQARYSVAGAELPFFIMVANPDDAAKAWQSFQGFCKRFGKVEVLRDQSGGHIFRAQVFGKWKVIYQRAGELGGVFDAADADQARAFVEKYLRGEIK